MDINNKANKSSQHNLFYLSRKPVASVDASLFGFTLALVEK